MTDSDIKTAARRVLEEIFPADDEVALAEMISEDFVNHEAPAGTPPGRGSITFYMHLLADAFSEQRWTIHRVLAEGDTAGHAAHLRDRQRIAAFAADHAGPRLSQERHALLGLALLHQGLPVGVHRHQLQVGVATSPPDLGRLPRQRLASNRVIRDIRGRPQELTAQFRDLVLDDPCRACQPSAGCCRIA